MSKIIPSLIIIMYLVGNVVCMRGGDDDQQQPPEQQKYRRTTTGRQASGGDQPTIPQTSSAHSIGPVTREMAQMEIGGALQQQSSLYAHPAGQRQRPSERLGIDQSQHGAAYPRADQIEMSGDSERNFQAWLSEANEPETPQSYTQPTSHIVASTGANPSQEPKSAKFSSIGRLFSVMGPKQHGESFDKLQELKRQIQIPSIPSQQLESNQPHPAHSIRPSDRLETPQPHPAHSMRPSERLDSGQPHPAPSMRPSDRLKTPQPHPAPSMRPSERLDSGQPHPAPSMRPSDRLKTPQPHPAPFLRPSERMESDQPHPAPSTRPSERLGQQFQPAPSTRPSERIVADSQVYKPLPIRSGFHNIPELSHRHSRPSDRLGFSQSHSGPSTRPSERLATTALQNIATTNKNPINLEGSESENSGAGTHTRRLRPSSRIKTETGTSDDYSTEFYQTRMGMVDLNTCQGTNWLSNLVIDAYLELITSNAPNLGVIPSYAITTFRTSRQFPSQWLSKININGVQLWFIPAHIKLQGKLDHWALAVMDTYERTLSLYDSLNPGESSEEKDDYMRDTIAFFHALYDAKQVPFGGVPIEQHNMINVPRQENGYDCGVFVLMIAQIIALEQNTNTNLSAKVSQQKMPQYRKKIHEDLLKEKLDIAPTAASSQRLRPSEKLEKETATSHAVRPSQKITSFKGEQNIVTSQTTSRLKPSSRINTEIEDDYSTEFYQTRMGMVDLNTCLGTNWLSNLVIDAYLELITSNAPNLGVIPSYAITTFRTSREFPSQWLSKININGVQLWFIPAHIKLQGKLDHWALAVMDTYERTLSLYDSLNPGESSEEKDDYMRDTIAFFHALHDAKQVPFGGVPIEQHNMINVPRQENGYDCGVFVLMIAQIIALEQNTNTNLSAKVSQQRMPQYRKKIHKDLLKEKFGIVPTVASSQRLRPSEKVEKEIATSHAVRPSQKITSFEGEQNIRTSQMEGPIFVTPIPLRPSTMRKQGTHAAYFLAPLSAEDLETCIGNNPLNTSVINAYLERIILATENTNFIPVNFINQWSEEGEFQQSWLDTIKDIRKIKFWFIPVHFTSIHWAMAVLDVNLMSGISLSLFDSSSDQTLNKEKIDLMEKISKFFKEFYEKKGYPLTDEYETVKQNSIVHQKKGDSNDSAVYALMSAYVIALYGNVGVDLSKEVSHKKIQQLRKKIIEDLVSIKFSGIMPSSLSTLLKLPPQMRPSQKVVEMKQATNPADLHAVMKWPSQGAAYNSEATALGNFQSSSLPVQVKHVKPIKPTDKRALDFINNLSRVTKERIAGLPTMNSQELDEFHTHKTFKNFTYTHEIERESMSNLKSAYWRCLKRRICNARLGIYERNNQIHYRRTALHTCGRMEENNQPVIGRVCVRPHDQQRADYTVKLHCIDGNNLALSIGRFHQKNRSEDCVDYMVDVQFCLHHDFYFEVSGGGFRGKTYFQIDRVDLHGVNMLEFS